MDQLILQTSKQSLLMTPVSVDKAGKNIFGVPQQYELPDGLKDGMAVDNAPQLVNFVKDCMLKGSLAAEQIIICLENDHILSKEFQHLPCKQKNLPQLARLEAETMMPEGGTHGYMVESSEYNYRDETTGKYSSTLFAVQSKVVVGLRRAFDGAGLKVAMIVPPVTGLMFAGRSFTIGKREDLAFMDLDFMRSRLLVIHNSCIVYQHTFDGVFDDIVEIIRHDRGCSYEEAADLARRISFLETAPQTVTADSLNKITSLLNASMEEIIRNLGMVLSSERMELSGIIRCGALVTLPNFREFWDSQDLDVPLQDIKDHMNSVAVRHAPLPLPSPAALQAGYRADSFFTLGGLLSAKKTDRIDFMGQVQASVQHSKTYYVIMAAAAAAAVAFSLVQPIQNLAMQNKVKSNLQKLQDPRYVEVKNMHENQEELTKQLSDLKMNIAMLPFGKSFTNEFNEKIYSQVYDSKNIKSVEGYKIDNVKGLINLTVNVATYEKYLDLKHDLEKAKYFKVSVTLNADGQKPKGATDENIIPMDSYKVSIVLQPTKFAAWQTIANPQGGQ